MVVAINAINNTVGASISGVTNTLTVTNPSNTASSQAQVNVTVGGATAGDAFTTYTISGVTNWSQGIDNSVSDNYVVSASTALGTTDVMSMTTAGAVSYVLGNVDTTRSASGATVSNTISNTSNTASSNAQQQITVAGATAADAFTTYTVTGVTNWSVGLDNSASDAYVIAASTALGTTNVMSMATGGAVSVVLGDFDVTRSASGATVDITVSNTSNTASSNAQQQVTVAGTSAGDAFTTYTVAATTNWSTGLDNSASDAYVIAASTALGTTNVMSMATGGAVSVVLGDLDVTRSSSGGNVISTISNTSNTASSTARQQITVAGTSAGDAFTTYTVTGTTNWSIGTDNSVTGDPFVIAASATLGTTNIMSALTTGEINYPLLPAFLATKTAAQNNVTGDATTVVVGYSTEIYDQGGDYDAVNTFTAPVTGRYEFTAGLNFSGTLAGHNLCGFNFVASNRTINTNGFMAFNVTPTGATCILNAACHLDMDAADICQMLTNVNGSTLVIDLVGGFFAGSLMC